jgi:Skp family chaperone for outer membrane proteins
MTRKFLATAAGAAFALMAAHAQAQTPAAPAAAPAGPPTPTIAGICVINPDRILATSVVGKYADGRIQQINNDAAAEVNGEATKLGADKTRFETDAKAFNAKFEGLNEDQAKQLAATVQPQAQALQQTQQGLVQREQQLQQLSEIRSREVEATLEKARRTIIENMQGPLQEVFQARSCAIMIDQSAAPLVASAMEVSRDVVTKLDAKIQQFPIEREVMPTQQGGAAARPAAAAAPRAAAPRPAAAATPAKPAASGTKPRR